MHVEVALTRLSPNAIITSKSTKTVIMGELQFHKRIINYRLMKGGRKRMRS